MKCVSMCVFTAAWVAAAPALAQPQAPAEAREAPFGMPAQAQPASAPKPRPDMFAAASAAVARRLPPEQREERRFLKEAAAASRFESEAARLALSKSANANVRSFAATLVNHHASVAPVLLRLLHDRGMAQPMLGNDQRKTLNRLAKLGGTKFDREFLEEVGPRHQLEDVALYERAAAATRDPVLKAWVEQSLPTMKYHLTLAEKASPPELRLARQTAPAPRTPPAPVAPAQAPSPAPLLVPSLATPFAPEPQAMQFMGGPAFQMEVVRPAAATP